jgi:hypothetical protein
VDGCFLPYNLSFVVQRRHSGDEDLKVDFKSLKILNATSLMGTIVRDHAWIDHITGWMGKEQVVPETIDWGRL